MGHKAGTFIPFFLLFCIILSSRIFADDVSTNELVPLWKYAAGGELVSPPAVDENIYLYSEDRQVHAVSVDGKLLWKFRLSGRPADSLSVGRDGTVYASTLEGRLYAVNPGGKQIWSIDCGSALSGAPAVSADGTVFAGTLSGRLYAISHRGFVRWQNEYEDGITGSPVVDDGEAVYIITKAGELLSYNPWGSLRWSFRPEEQRRAADRINVAIDDHLVYITDGKSLSVVDMDGMLLWQIDLDSACAGFVVFKDGLFLRFTDGSVAAVNLSGKLLWKSEDRTYTSYPVSGNSHLFMLDRNSRGHSSLVSLGFSGLVEGRGMVEGINLTQPVIGSGILVCGSEQWVACAFKVSDTEGRGWSQQGGGASHSGVAGLGRWHFNEAEYLKNMDYLYLREALASGSVEEKLKAVREIGNRIAAEGIDRGERYLLHLLHAALTEGNRRVTVGKPPSSSDFPAVRREAARLIGLYGTFESVELLAAVLDEEKYYDVSAAIIYALGSLGTDYNNLAQIAIYNKVRKDNNGSSYDGLAAAAVDAVAMISGYSGTTGLGYGFRTLMEISRGNYSAFIRKRAGEVLRSIR